MKLRRFRLFGALSILAFGLFFLAVAFLQQDDPTILKPVSPDLRLKAERGDKAAQYQIGMSLLVTNLNQEIDRIPILGDLPFFRRRFRIVRYGFETDPSPETLTEAYRWIHQSALQNYPPAKSMEAMLAEKIETTKKFQETNSPPTRKTSH